MQRYIELEPLIYSLDLQTSPARAYRAITSQVELRKWWAPRVIMAKNIISHTPGKDMKMILVDSRENEFVRYKFYGLHWKNQPETTIAIEIQEKSIKRRNTGFGIKLDIYHEGWTNKEYRDELEDIWNKAIQSLTTLLNEEKVVHWWQKEKRKGEFRSATLANMKIFLNKMEEESRASKEKKKASKILWQIFQELDSYGEWYCKESYTEIEFYAKGQKIFGALKSGHIVMSWRELDPLLGRNLQDFADRFSIEQNNIEIHVGQNYEKIYTLDIIPELFIRWCIDIINYKTK